MDRQGLRDHPAFDTIEIDLYNRIHPRIDLFHCFHKKMRQFFRRDLPFSN